MGCPQDAEDAEDAEDADDAETRWRSLGEAAVKQIWHAKTGPHPAHNM